MAATVWGMGGAVQQTAGLLEERLQLLRDEGVGQTAHRLRLVSNIKDFFKAHPATISFVVVLVLFAPAPASGLLGFS